MAERPIFVAKPESRELVDEVFLRLTRSPGFGAGEKKENIKALHEAAENAGYRDVLEVSTKSANKRGRHLSAFHLRVKSTQNGSVPLECAFQGSKVFEHGGPFVDLFNGQPREAKKDRRLRESGQLVAFRFEGMDWPLEPKTAFYDWLYITSIYPHREWAVKLYAYGGFSDIEFDPTRSISCQARSIALFLSLMKRGQLDEAMKSPADFVNILRDSDYRPDLRREETRPTLLSA
ncbi:MAG: hypothetical protein JWQ49_6589 [Edaphobacter sp.]|nr:hypothetical protein [Edaphobacter sp.]